MNVMDVIGPVMVGPSSSHTAGAVRIGKVSRRLLGENVAAAHIGLYGSFLATGPGFSAWMWTIWRFRTPSTSRGRSA